MEYVRSVDGTRIGYLRSGTGPPLLLVHGATADHRSWSGIVPQFTSHFTVYAIDRRGRRASGDAPNYHLLREAEDIAAVAAAAGEPVHLFGHSYGGLICLEAALQLDSIRRLILYEPAIPTGVPVFPQDTIDRLQALIDRGEWETAMELFFRDIVRMPEHELALYRRSPLWDDRLRHAPTLPRELAVERTYRFEPERFANLQAPTLLLLGGDSPTEVRKEVETAQAALPNSRVRVMPGQQHAAHYTNPDLFVSEILRFLLD